MVKQWEQTSNTMSSTILSLPGEKVILTAGDKGAEFVFFIFQKLPAF